MTAWQLTKSAYKSALPILGVSAVGGLVAGSVLGGMEAELTQVPGLLVMVPAFLAIRGSVYGSLGSRLSSSLHQGLIEPVFKPDDRIARAVLAAFLNGLMASFFAALLTFVVLSTFNSPVAPLWMLGMIAILGAVFAGIALSLVVVAVVFIGFRRGMNPDDIVGPTMTTTGDIFGMGFLFVATRITLAIA